MILSLVFLGFICAKTNQENTFVINLANIDSSKELLSQIYEKAQGIGFDFKNFVSQDFIANNSNAFLTEKQQGKDSASSQQKQGQASTQAKSSQKKSSSKGQTQNKSKTKTDSQKKKYKKTRKGFTEVKSR